MKKGFTLIELLVVLAVIAVIASVLLINFASTNNKAKASKIKFAMSQIRTGMESFYSIGNTYTGGCAGGTDCNKLKLDIVANGGTGVVQNITTILVSPSKYCLKYNLPGGGSWCIDYTGYAGATANCGSNFDFP